MILRAHRYRYARALRRGGPVALGDEAQDNSEELMAMGLYGRFVSLTRPVAFLTTVLRVLVPNTPRCNIPSMAPASPASGPIPAAHSNINEPSHDMAFQPVVYVPPGQVLLSK